MKLILKAVSMGLLIVYAPALASDKEPEWKTLDVPKEIVTKQEIVNTPAGWACAKETHPNVLSAVTISDGPPENEASLVYDKVTRQKNKLIATWRCETDVKEHDWISCSYAGTVVVIKRQLPDGIKELRILYDDEVKTDGLPTVEKVEYR